MREYNGIFGAQYDFMIMSILILVILYIFFIRKESGERNKSFLMIIGVQLLNIIISTLVRFNNATIYEQRQSWLNFIIGAIVIGTIIYTTVNIFFSETADNIKEKKLLLYLVPMCIFWILYSRLFEFVL